MTNLLRLPEVQRRTGLRKSKIYLLMRNGKFPEPVKLGARVSAWPDFEVERWVQAQIQSRGARL